MNIRVTSYQGGRSSLVNWDNVMYASEADSGGVIIKFREGDTLRISESLAQLDNELYTSVRAAESEH